MTTTTNTTGMISKSVVSEPKQKSAATIMKNIINSKATQEIIKNSLKENAGAFTASVIDLYNSDRNLQACNPQQVMGECLKAVSLKLPISKQLGFAYVIPYKGTATFQIGYKGYIQLCMRTGAYKHINAGEVYEGELVSQDKLTGEIDLSGERTGDSIIGYFAFIETLNGFRKTLYWTKEKVIEHAKKHSASYKSNNDVWKDHFDAMATKTVLRNLLDHYGVMSVELEKAFVSENTEFADKQLSKDKEDETEPIEGEFTEFSDEQTELKE
jgi:recombination protein RecT